MVIRASDTLETLKEKVRLATILGTFQSTLTNFSFVSEEYKQNCEEERLLGVSFTGIMDHVTLSGQEGFDKAKLWLNELRDYARSVNKEWAETLGINESVAITCVKPSGCTVLETEVRTNTGNQTLRSLFAECGFSDTDLLSMPAGTWIKPEVEVFVFDENNELQQVTNLFINGVCSTFEIEFGDGNKYKFTGNHKLKTNSGWKKVDELTEEDEIISFS